MGAQDTAAALREQKRKVRKLTEHLTKLTGTVMSALAAVDKIGARKDLPNDIGKELARIANAVELANDSARYFGLGVDWRKDDKRAALPSPALSKESSRHE